MDMKIEPKVGTFVRVVRKSVDKLAQENFLERFIADGNSYEILGKFFSEWRCKWLVGTTGPVSR